jgi:hypothetical protein
MTPNNGSGSPPRKLPVLYSFKLRLDLTRAHVTHPIVQSVLPQRISEHG